MKPKNVIYSINDRPTRIHTKNNRAVIFGDPAHVSMPGVHRVASLLKRWILGTHQGSVVPDHLQSYLEEFTFRFNREQDDLVFYTRTPLILLISS